MSTSSLLKTAKALIFAVIIGTPFFYFRWGVFPYTLAKILFFQAAVELLFFVWLLLAFYEPRFRPQRTPLIAASGVFLAVMFFAALNGVDMWRSLWSTYERGTGLVAMAHFAVFGLILSTLRAELPWKRILSWSVGVSAAVSVVSFLQIYVPDLLLIENPGSRPGSTFGNPAFMTGYLLFNIFIAAYLFFGELDRNGRNKASVFFAVAGIADIVAVFLSQTRADIMALFAGIVTLLIVFSVKPPRAAGIFSVKRTYIVALTAIVALALAFSATRNAPFWKSVPGLSRFSSFSLSSDASVAPRLSALRAGWQGFIEKPLLGWGPENFAPVYDRHYDPKDLEFSYGETHFDKPHNLFLEYADSGGIILFLAFIAFLAAAVYETLKQKDALWRAVFISSLVSFCVSQFFFFETVGTLLMLFLMFAVSDGAFRDGTGEAVHPQGAVPPTSGNKIPPAAVWISLAAALVPVWMVNAKSLIASNYQYDGFQHFLAQDIFLGMRSFDQSINAWSPYSWNFRRDFAIAAAGQYFNYPGTLADEDALRAVKAMESVRDEHPEDAFNHYALVNIYNEVSALDKKGYTAKAEAEAKTALEISPGRQEAYFYLAKTKSIEGDYAGALTVLKKALDEDPKIADSHFYYGLIAFAVGDRETGYKEIKTAISMGRQWKTFYEPRTVAGFFADYGHLDEAITLYKTAWDISYHSDIDSEVKLGVAYFYAKQYDNARFYLGEAVSKFDVVSSPSYGQLRPILDELGVKYGGK